MEVLNNKYVSTTITIGLGLYAALLGPNLPKFVKDLFSNTLFRILILFLVVVRGNKDPQMAIMIAIAFVLTLDYIHVKDIKEKFAEACPSGTKWDNRMEKCIPDCKNGSVYDNRAGQCSPECPAPAKFSLAVNACYDSSAPNCASDSGWNVNTKQCEKCIPRTSAGTMDRGTTRNSRYNICVPDQ